MNKTRKLLTNLTVSCVMVEWPLLFQAATCRGRCFGQQRVSWEQKRSFWGSVSIMTHETVKFMINFLVLFNEILHNYALQTWWIDSLKELSLQFFIIISYSYHFSFISSFLLAYIATFSVHSFRFALVYSNKHFSLKTDLKEFSIFHHHFIVFISFCVYI